VISCVLSDSVLPIALSLMTPWVRGRSISFTQNDDMGLLLPSDRGQSRRSGRSRGVAA
jgi:hypothetical protein